MLCYTTCIVHINSRLIHLKFDQHHRLIYLPALMSARSASEVSKVKNPVLCILLARFIKGENLFNIIFKKMQSMRFGKKYFANLK